MGSRAIRKLRGDAGLIPQLDGEEDSEEELTPAKKPAFVYDDSSSEEEDESSDDNDDEPYKPAAMDDLKPPPPTVAEKSQEEDLDALLDEFQAKDLRPSSETTTALFVTSNYFALVTKGLDVRDLDIDWSMRNSLMGSSNSTEKSVRKGRKTLFGPPRDGWTRPPNYVGGGLGMTSYDIDPRSIPWPYSDPSLVEVDQEARQAWSDARNWFTFQYSDSYAKDSLDYETIQQSGDINALILFIAHHPYVVGALLQLSSVLYQCNHSQEGLALLRRCLWVYETAMLLRFTRDLDDLTLLDYKQPENATFFQALSKLAQVSNIAGLPSTALAVNRFLVSLDPLRDPQGVMLSMDHFALACNQTAVDQWLVQLVESETIRVWYRDDERIYSGDLLSMPNWMYSYALAVFRLQQEDENEVMRAKADHALQQALQQFPCIVGLLLQQNEVDTTGRSFRRDWITVLDYATDREAKQQYHWSATKGVDTVEMSATLQSVDTIVKIFVKQNARLWGSDDVLQWVYDNLAAVQASDAALTDPPSPALMRYAAAIPADYDNAIPQLPPDANIIDPNLLAHAMAVDPNRRRFLRRQRPDDQQGEHDEGFHLQEHVLGGPPTGVVDPDWPMAEVFWRSFLPWNHVEGVPPPRR